MMKAKAQLTVPLLLLICSCEFSMQTEPEPHSIEFSQEKFDSIASFFVANPELNNFDLEQSPKEIPEDIRIKMKEIGLLEFRNVEGFLVFFCGYGVVGKGWGFIHGEFNEQQLEGADMLGSPDIGRIDITYLEHLEGKWHRFACS